MMMVVGVFLVGVLGVLEGLGDQTGVPEALASMVDLVGAPEASASTEDQMEMPEASASTEDQREMPEVSVDQAVLQEALTSTAVLVDQVEASMRESRLPILWRLVGLVRHMLIAKEISSRATALKRRSTEYVFVLGSAIRLLIVVVRVHRVRLGVRDDSFLLPWNASSSVIPTRIALSATFVPLGQVRDLQIPSIVSEWTSKT